MIRMNTARRHAVHQFDIDNYLNRIVPRSRLYILPKPVSHWFGFRAPTEGEPKAASPPTSVLLVWLFSFLGAFIGISIIENVFQNLPQLGGHSVPIVIASFGAAAILEYNTIESPLSQPRNLMLGQLLSAAIGVSITKLFQMLPEARFYELQWLAGALSVACASTVMGMTKTVHPPAGATALLAATSSDVTALGWWLLPLVLLASSLMLASAMLVNNLYKRFPLYWWTAADLSKLDKSDVVTVNEAEKADARSGSDSSINSASDVGMTKNAQPQAVRNGSDATYVGHDQSEQFKTVEEKRQRNIHNDPELKVQIEVDRIVVPDWMSLSQWEVEVLEGFQTKLRDANR